MVVLFSINLLQVNCYGKNYKHYAKLNVVITFYSPKDGNINCDSDCSQTAFGKIPKSNRTVAISRSLLQKGIKSGTTIYIPKIGYRVVEDLMGKSVKGHAVDVSVDSKEKAFRLGKYNESIYLIISEN